MKKYFKIILLVIICTVFSAVFSLCANASVNDKKSLQIICENEETDLSGVEISVFEALEETSDGYKLAGAFKDYRVRVDASSSSALQETANTLANYVVTDKITPLATVTSDETGKAAFDNLDGGIYLVYGKKLTVDKKIYRLSPMFVEISRESDDVTVAYGKFSVSKVKNSRMTKYTVNKVWDNERELDGYRPEEIEVEIYLDGELYDTVKLNDDNNWSYFWNTDEVGDWNFKEVNVPEEYEVTIGIGEYDATITNRLDDSVIESNPNPPDDSDTDNDTDKDDNTNDNEDIPQTGQLWWPVPVLVILGVVLIALGLKIGLKGEKE